MDSWIEYLNERYLKYAYLTGQYNWKISVFNMAVWMLLTKTCPLHKLDQIASLVLIILGIL